MEEDDNDDDELLGHYITLPLIKTYQIFKVTCQIQCFRAILNTQTTEETNTYLNNPYIFLFYQNYRVLRKTLSRPYVRHPATLIWVAT